MSEQQETSEPKKKETGPYIYENWLGFLKNEETEYTYEYPLFSDAHIVGEITEGFGPYQLLNGLAISPPRVFRPAVVLRVATIKPTTDIPPNYDWTTDTARYHGGYFEDEVAALISLSLGVRMKAGAVNREFRRGGDPLGRPVAYEQVDLTSLRPARALNPILPYAVDEPYLINKISLEAVDALAALPFLTPQDATALVVAARSYQNALLVAEGEPALAWLFLVSAVETAANHWNPKNRTPLVVFHGRIEG